MRILKFIKAYKSHALINAITNIPSNFLTEALKKIGYEQRKDGKNLKKTKIIIGIYSKPSPEHAILRKIQRKTWLSRATFDYRFVLPENSKNKFPELIEEDAFYGDLVFLKMHENYLSPINLKAWFIYADQNFSDDYDLFGRAEDVTWVCSDVVAKEIDEFLSKSHRNKDLDYFYYTWSKFGYKSSTNHLIRQNEQFFLLGKKLVKELINRPVCEAPAILPSNDEEAKNIRKDLECLRKLPKIQNIPYNGPYNQKTVTTTQFSLWIEDLKNNFLKDRFFTYPENQRTEFSMRNDVPDFCNTYVEYANVDSGKRILKLEQSYQNHNSNSGGGSATSGKLFEGQRIKDYHEHKLPKLTSPKIASFYNQTSCNHKNFAVVTTIFEATSAVKNIANMKNWCIIIVADLKSKNSVEDYGLTKRDNVIYLTVVNQVELYPHFSNVIPYNHFGRKNLGYLFAIDAGAEKIWDFDDDNDGMVDERQVFGNLAEVCSDAGMFLSEHKAMNPYMHFGVNETISWARGFPLDLILEKSTYEFQTCRVSEMNNVAVIQSLANKQPDVDGIYRLTRQTPFDFISRPGDNDTPDLIIPTGKYTPFNAQATLWYKRSSSSPENFSLLYLPITVHGRVADIWRSYFTQWVFHNTNKALVFSKPYVIQDRNVHNYLADFNSEHDLYYKSGILIEILSELKYDENLSVQENLINLYVEMLKRDIIGEKDVEIVKIWLQHVFVYRR